MIATAPLSIAARLRALEPSSRKYPVSEVFGPADPSHTITFPLASILA